MTVKSVVKVRFPNGRMYEYEADGSPAELEGATAAVVTSAYGTSLVFVVSILPIEQKEFRGQLKYVDALLYPRINNV